MLITPIGTIMLWKRLSHPRVDSLDAFFHIIEGFGTNDKRKLMKQRQLLHVITFLIREKKRYAPTGQNNVSFDTDSFRFASFG